METHFSFSWGNDAAHESAYGPPPDTPFCIISKLAQAPTSQILLLIPEQNIPPALNAPQDTLNPSANRESFDQGAASSTHTRVYPQQ